MPDLGLTGLEIAVVLDALERLSALTSDEMADTLDWSSEQIEAWSSALGKIERAAHATGQSA